MLIISVIVLHIVHNIIGYYIDLNNKVNNIILLIDYVISFLSIFILNRYYIKQKIYTKMKMSKSYIINVFIILYFSYCIYILLSGNWFTKFSIRYFEMSLGAGILEEYVFRGIILPLFIKKLSFGHRLNSAYIMGIGFSSFLFLHYTFLEYANK